MRLRLIAAVLAALLAPAAALAGLAGKYNVSGTNLDGSTYTGTVVVTQTSNSTYALVWSTGETQSTGIGMSSGNIFGAAYVLQDKPGLVLYEIRPDGSLSGYWTAAGMDGVAMETWTPAP